MDAIHNERLAHLARNTGFAVHTCIHAEYEHTHAQTQAAGRSKHELTEPTVYYITDLVENEEALLFSLFLFLSLASARHRRVSAEACPLWTHLSKRCLEPRFSHGASNLRYRRCQSCEGSASELLIEDEANCSGRMKKKEAVLCQSRAYVVWKQRRCSGHSRKSLTVSPFDH